MTNLASPPLASVSTKRWPPPFLLHPSVFIGGLLVTMIILVAVLAPLLGTVDPSRIAPSMRLKPPSELAWFGTDLYGRDVYSRAIYGARSSILIGLCVAAAALIGGVAIGLVTGYFRWVDAVVMRIMDGLMAIPTFLLAIALVSLTRANVATVIVALTIPEIPRVVRLVRSVVLTVREEPFVEAAKTVGTSTPKLLWRHILPSTTAPLMVLGTYICASAILIEAGLSFLGTGLPPEIPSWGNMISEGRTFFQVAPRLVFLPSLFLALTVLGINLLGDGLRDTLDPRIAKRM
ncbi:ABC transporter permease [Microvirga zambiensis]|uniref:ABC transporter permease n=1 Tax=Microvirga zambiensis TaxID=1402137 RepID=UPI00191F78A4|nr:ABC transporter permease [Microvirga zambiensis]